MGSDVAEGGDIALPSPCASLFQPLWARDASYLLDGWCQLWPGFLRFPVPLPILAKEREPAAGLGAGKVKET